MKKRQGEDAYAWFRSNRFYRVKDCWFFATREGVDYGPFNSLIEADEALQEYMQRKRKSKAAATSN